MPAAFSFTISSDALPLQNRRGIALGRRPKARSEAEPNSSAPASRLAARSYCPVPRCGGGIGSARSRSGSPRAEPACDRWPARWSRSRCTRASSPRGRPFFRPYRLDKLTRMPSVATALRGASAAVGKPSVLHFVKTQGLWLAVVLAAIAGGQWLVVHDSATPIVSSDGLLYISNADQITSLH